MTDILDLKLFTRVARLGSFSAAAREARLAQSQVSRVIADLEARLGARLLSRTTRAVTPTEAGSIFLSRVEPIIAAFEDAENSVRETGDLRGLLRVSMPSTMATQIVLPRLSSFAERHPKLVLEILLDDSWQDMVREAVDVGIRVGHLPDASGTSRLIGAMHRVIVASPSYLTRHGTPASPRELAHHRIVGGPAASQATSWRLERDGEAVDVDVRPNISTNDTVGALAATVSGLGITSTTSWACSEGLASGALVRLFAEWQTADIPVHAYFPLGRATRKSARAFVDYLAAALVDSPP